MTARHIFLVASIIAFSFMNVITAHAQANAVAWKAGKIYVSKALAANGKACAGSPDSPCAHNIKRGKHPVIVFLHGCDGPRRPTVFFNLGAIIVAPDSFAGGARCKQTAQAMQALFFERMAAVANAATQVKLEPWADPDHLVLAGFSHGAMITALYNGSEYKARILIAYACHPLIRNADGVHGQGPVLALMGTADEYNRSHGTKGNCASALAKRPGSRSILIKGGRHDIMQHTKTRSALVAFVPSVIK